MLVELTAIDGTILPFNPLRIVTVTPYRGSYESKKGGSDVWISGNPDDTFYAKESPDVVRQRWIEALGH